MSATRPAPRRRARTGDSVRASVPVRGPAELYPGDRTVRALTRLLADLHPGARVSVYAPNPYRRRLEVVTGSSTSRLPLVVDGRSVLLSGVDVTSRLRRRAVLDHLSAELVLGEGRVSNDDAVLADELLAGLSEEERRELEEVVGPGRTSERTLPGIVAVARAVRDGSGFHEALLAADARLDPVRAELAPGERLLLRDLVVGTESMVGPVEVDVLRVHGMRNLDYGARPLRVEVRRSGVTRVFLLSHSGLTSVGARPPARTALPYLPRTLTPDRRRTVGVFVRAALEDGETEVVSNAVLRRFLPARDLLDGWGEWSFARDASFTHAHPRDAAAALAYARDVESGAPPVWAAHRAEAAHRARERHPSS